MEIVKFTHILNDALAHLTRAIIDKNEHEFYREMNVLCDKFDELLVKLDKEVYPCESHDEPNLIKSVKTYARALDRLSAVGLEHGLNPDTCERFNSVANRIRKWN